jgi:CDP-paratose 2-epimerase
MKKLLVTGSSGLIGSETVRFFDDQGWKVHGVDNNMRAQFFGSEGDTEWNRHLLQNECRNFTHLPLDIRDRARVLKLMEELKPDLIVHCAAQPSHDHAAKIPFDDFDVNAGGTLNLLEATRLYAPEAVFILMSTNKVYGDTPNFIKLKELPTRWEYDDVQYENGIPETLSVDHTTHSLFGAGKLSADVYAQEYGRYFGMKVGIFRGGCLTGPAHSSAKLHGHLAFLFKTVSRGEVYQIQGYKGKQVRDQIHSFDVARLFFAFLQTPRSGETYNLGGGKSNSISILESFQKIESITGRKINYVYEDQPRKGDHICYYSDLRKICGHFPEWKVSRNLDSIFEELARVHRL